MTAPTILLVEDDPSLRMLTARALQENGFSVRPASAAPEMWLALDSGPVDLVLLDIMLPGTSGIDLCRSLRQKSDVPIIFMSARASETDRVVGLELGADDYIAKPFGTRELVARVRAVLRRPALDRRAGASDQGMLTFDGWTVNLPRRELTSPTGAIVDLTGAEFDLLVVLADHAQRVIARERLIELSRTRLGDSSDRSIDVLVSRLRRKLGSAGAPAPIVTVRGVGYMLNAPVERR
ncbi:MULTISPECIES: response regulator [Sphingomonas]|jgi:DNA-binding response OmpR family regulator|uniref:Regulatory protein VirG n=2 Tax=Sphingomonas TaxID=13687 RepID=A0A2A4I5R3_9SPHN|nr:MULTISPECIES: response regulator transcription factor [Sphingomonas]MBY0302298.1 response regulator transcription factor [Sphingomonas ginsenosidimutans]PCG09174.1 DNA-binding response regulator [Sphingomonas ginsenosidimutans]PCG13506.1 DNA-binding response regulator [Sphingomonas adhaesiva]PZU75985.1 MAG: DNA-binding response regulator [Sphingomonas sp.]